MYGSTTKSDVVKRSDCTYTSVWEHYQGDVVKRSDCIQVYGSTTKGGVVKRSDCILVYGSTTKGGAVKRSECKYSTIHIGMVLYSQSFQSQ